MTSDQFHELQRDFRAAYTELEMGVLLVEPYHNAHAWSEMDTGLKLGQVSRALSAIGNFMQHLVASLGYENQFAGDLRRFELELRMGQLVSIEYHGSSQETSFNDLELKLGQVSRALSFLARVLEHLQQVLPPNATAQRESHGMIREIRNAQAISIVYRGSTDHMTDREVKRKIHFLSRSLWHVLRLLNDLVSHIPRGR